MHRDHAVAAAVGQCLAVGLGQVGGHGTCGRDVRPVVDVVGHRVDPVAQIRAVDQNVQRHLANSPPLQLVRFQPRRRIGDHHDGHGQSPATSETVTPASARPFIISSATACVRLEVPVDAVRVAAPAHHLVADGGLQIDDRHVVLAPPRRDRGDRAVTPAVRLAVGVGDVHRRDRRHERNAWPVEVDCGPGLFEVVGAQVRRQRGPRDRRQPRLQPAVSVAGPPPQPRRPDVADQLAHRRRQRRWQRIHAAGREDHRAGARQRRPRTRILGGRPPHVAAGPADPADQLDIPTELGGNDVGPDPRIVGGQSAGRSVVGQRVAEDQQCSRVRQRTSLATCAEAFQTSSRHRTSSAPASGSE